MLRADCGGREGRTEGHHDDGGWDGARLKRGGSTLAGMRHDRAQVRGLHHGNAPRSDRSRTSSSRVNETTRAAKSVRSVCHCTRSLVNLRGRRVVRKRDRAQRR